MELEFLVVDLNVIEPPLAEAVQLPIVGKLEANVVVKLSSELELFHVLLDLENVKSWVPVSLHDNVALPKA